MGNPGLTGIQIISKKSDGTGEIADLLGNLNLETGTPTTGPILYTTIPRGEYQMLLEN